MLKPNHGTTYGLAVIVALILGVLTPINASSQELPIDQIKKTVVYLEGDFPCHEPLIKNGLQAKTPEGSPIFQSSCSQVGTGFLISYPTPDQGAGSGVTLLVTSKHLIEHQRLGAPRGEMEYFATITATANTRKPNSQNSYISAIPIAVKVNGFLSCSIDNKDADADVAVCPISIPEATYDIRNLSRDMCVTKATIQNLRLNETDEVLFSGLFLPYHGASKNYPIVRHGKLALIPEEKISWSSGPGGNSMQDLYLAEIASWGGNSGSPVFVRLSGTREQGNSIGGVQYFLLGVMQGYFNSDRPAGPDTASITVTAHSDVRMSDNSGIAAVVPAEKILDILGQPRIKAFVTIIKALSNAKAGNASQAESSFRESIEMLRTSDPNHPLLREALTDYASFLRKQGHYPEADFQMRLADAMNKVNNVPDDQLR